MSPILIFWPLENDFLSGRCQSNNAICFAWKSAKLWNEICIFQHDHTVLNIICIKGRKLRSLISTSAFLVKSKAGAVVWALTSSVARVRDPALTPYDGWLCFWFCPLVFSPRGFWYSGFPNTSKFRFDLTLTLLKLENSSARGDGGGPTKSAILAKFAKN